MEITLVETLISWTGVISFAQLFSFFSSSEYNCKEKLAIKNNTEVLQWLTLNYIHNRLHTLVKHVLD